MQEDIRITIEETIVDILAYLDDDSVPMEVVREDVERKLYMMMDEVIGYVQV